MILEKCSFNIPQDLRIRDAGGIRRVARSEEWRDIVSRGRPHLLQGEGKRRNVGIARRLQKRKVNVISIVRVEKVIAYEMQGMKASVWNV